MVFDFSSDIAKAFGPTAALVAKRNRALRAYALDKNFRWHGNQHLRDIKNAEFNLRYSIMESCEYGVAYATANQEGASK